MEDDDTSKITTMGEAPAVQGTTVYPHVRERCKVGVKLTKAQTAKAQRELYVSGWGDRFRSRLQDPCGPEAVTGGWHVGGAGYRGCCS